MAPRKRTATAKEPDAKLSLAVALDFIKAAQVDKPGDLVVKTHCRLAGGYAVAYDGVLAIAYPIEEELNICPHTHRLIDALGRCKKAVSITQLDADKLVIKSGNFRAVVPCLNPAALPYVAPDVQAGIIDDRLKEGFALLNPIVSGSGNTVVESSLLLQNNSMIATDRHIMLEFWHGINLPNGLALPKVAIATIAKMSAKLVGIGVSDRTVTFYLDNGAWLRTQLYAEQWPDISRVINAGDPYNTPEIPPAFFEAVEAVAPFSEIGVAAPTSGGGCVYTLDGYVSSHYTEGVGATYQISGVPPGLCFSAKHLLSVKNIATKFDFVGKNGISYFFGGNVRGALTQRKG
jgi:hypothetical protein